MTHQTIPQRKVSEEGMAMLLVLGIIAATTLLTIHAMAFAEAINRESAVITTIARLRLENESAADYAFWMHLTDRRLFSSRTVGNDLSDRDAISDFEPWMLDSREHEIDDHTYAYLNDAIKSFSVNKINQLTQNFDQDDTEGIEMADTFIDIYKDYTDNNDYINLNGKEVDDYALDGFPTLPRNDAMQYRAELYWLDGWRDVITSDITIIPPKGITIPNNNNTKPNFFTASETDIRNTLLQKALDISDANIEAVLDARRQWLADSIPIADTLDADLLITVKNHFSFQESGYAEITTLSTAYDGAIQASRTVTREVNMSSTTIFADKAKETFSIWETRNY